MNLQELNMNFFKSENMPQVVAHPKFNPVGKFDDEIRENVNWLTNGNGLSGHIERGIHQRSNHIIASNLPTEIRCPILAQ